MSDVTLDALVEDLARAMHRDAHNGRDCWDAENEDLRTAWRSSARAALAAVAKAAGGAVALRNNIAPLLDNEAARSRARWPQCEGHADICERVAALLRTLAEAAPQEASDG